MYQLATTRARSPACSVGGGASRSVGGGGAAAAPGETFAGEKGAALLLPFAWASSPSLFLPFACITLPDAERFGGLRLRSSVSAAEAPAALMSLPLDVIIPEAPAVASECALPMSVVNSGLPERASSRGRARRTLWIEPSTNQSWMMTHVAPKA